MNLADYVLLINKKHIEEGGDNSEEEQKFKCIVSE